MIDMEIKHMTNHRASTVRKAQVEVKRLWALMCGWDSIAVGSLFVQFSSTNPFTKDYNKAMGKFLRLRRGNQSLADLRAQHNVIVSALAAKARQ
jgi:hypothetical protein